MARALGVIGPLAVALAAGFALTACGSCGSKDTKATPDAGAAASSAGSASGDGGLLAESKNATPVAASVVAKYLNPSDLPKYEGPTAILEGNVYVRGPAAPDLDPPARSSCKNVTDYRLFREGAADPSGRRPLADAVVGVTGYSGFYVPARGDAVSVNIKDCSFDHRTVVLTFGQRLEVVNTEPLNSGTYYAPKLTKDLTSSQMIAAPGNTVKLYFQKPGRDLLVDGMGHGHLYADVYAAVHALHVVTDSAGHFILPGVPVGEYDATAMHPAFDDGGVHQKLVFKPGQTTHHDFELTYVPKPKRVEPADGGRPQIH